MIIQNVFQMNTKQFRGKQHIDYPSEVGVPLKISMDKSKIDNKVDLGKKNKGNESTKKLTDNY